MTDATQRSGEAAADEEFLVEVTKRAPLLAALRGGPKSLGELDERLSSSRSTVHRSTRTLESAGVIRRTDGGYALTAFGRRVADEALSYRDAVDTAHRLAEFIDVAEPAGVDVPLERFADAVVARPQPHQAHHGVKRVIGLIESNDAVRLFSSIISPFYVEAARREMLAGTSVEVVFDAPVIDIVERKYREEAEECFETGNFDVHVADGVPFELFLAGDLLGMAAHDERGLPRVFVETDDPAAVEWGEELYRTYLEEARRFEL